MDLTKSYLYGISDFWVTMLRDRDLIEKYLDANLEGFAGLYGQFLQSTSGLSIQDVSIAARADLRFVPIIVDAPIKSTAYEIALPELFSEIKYLSGSPLLSVVVLESGADFIVQQTTTKSVLRFAKPFTTYGFPYAMVEVDGVTKYIYSLWAQDCAIDQQLISRIYAPLVEQSPQVSTSLFQRFIEGLFRLYTGGPTLHNMRNGLCLAFGVPVSRYDGEVVLLTGQDVMTGQSWVITSIDTYYLPYGVDPSVASGDVLEAGTALADIVVVNDYLSDSEWWVNMYVPPEILKMTGDTKGRAIALGSVEDEIMREWLKTHLFLVNVKWKPEYALGDPTQLKAILRRAKPAHTYGILVVSQNLGNDEITAEDALDWSRVKKLADEAGPIQYIHRDGSGNNALRRSDLQFVRANMDDWSAVCLSRPETETVDPEVVIPASAFLTVSPSEIVTSVSRLWPLYSCTKGEAAAKIALSGNTPPLTWEYMTAIEGAYGADPVLLTREEASLPISGLTYYSSALLASLGLTDVTEASRSYYESAGSTIVLLFIAPVETLDLINVYVVVSGAARYVQFPLEEMDELRYRLSSDPPGTWTELP